MHVNIVMTKKKNHSHQDFLKPERLILNQRFRNVMDEGNSKENRQLGTTSSQFAPIKIPQKSKTVVAGRRLNSPLPMSKIK